jgi:hypothetical protein
MSTRTWLVTGTVAGMLLLTGCQGDEEPGGTGTPTPTGATARPTGAGPTTEEPTVATSTDDENETTEDETTEDGSETSSGSATATETSSTDEPTGDATETEVPSALPPWTGGQVQEAPGQAESGQEITGVRTGVHDGYDRVVLDLTGDEPALGWFGRLVDEALEDPSGLPLDVEGERFLQLGVAGIDWTVESPDRYDGATVQGQGTEVVTEVAFGALFEGQQQILIGLREDTDYRVFSLPDPARIVIDVRHP